MGLFDNIFGKKLPISSPASDAMANEVAELRSQNLQLQKLVESLQAEVEMTRFEAVPNQRVITEPSVQLNSLVMASNLSAFESTSEGRAEQDEASDTLDRKVGSDEGELASADRQIAGLQLSNALRQLLTERLLIDLHDSKLEIVRLCAESMELQPPDGSGLPVGGVVAVDECPHVTDAANDAIEELREKLIAADMEKHALEMQLQRAKEVQERLTLDEERELIARKVQSETAGIKAQLLHVQGLLDAATAKIQDQQLLRERIDAAEIENSALKKGVGPQVWALRQELELQSKEVATLKDQLGRQAFYNEAQSRRLAEREATINKNFAELQRREVELRDAKTAMSGCTPEVVSALREKSKALQDQLNAVTLSSRQKLMRLQEELEAAEDSVQSLLATKKELERSLETARRKTPISIERAKGSIGSTGSLVPFTDRKIVDWMVEEASPEQAEVDHGYLSLMGQGPWGKEQFGLLMEEHGFSLWQLPDHDVRHVVVGRTNWDADALEEQIAAMGAVELRIYSQEMWFAKLVTGRDPFDSGDHDLLMAFAKGHDALEYLIARDNPWPEVTSQDLLLGDGVFIEGTEFGATSPLHNFGYQVGASSGLTQRERRAILADFLEARSLTFDAQSSEDYRSHWGRPRSVQRLFRVALHIKWLIGWQGKSPFRAQANQEWTEDLKWLKDTYYKPTLHKFKWPTV